MHEVDGFEVLFSSLGCALFGEFSLLLLVFGFLENMRKLYGIQMLFAFSDFRARAARAEKNSTLFQPRTTYKKGNNTIKLVLISLYVVLILRMYNNVSVE